MTTVEQNNRPYGTLAKLWESVVNPILSTVKPENIVEVGSDFGHLTQKLLEFCYEHGGEVHSIDPAPKYDADVFRKKYGDRLHMHKAKSIDALPLLTQYDAVIIDGDHNWHTVYSELKIIEQYAKQKGAFPAVILHDTGWPYGRRDMYYAPESIPEELRKPYAQKGMVPWKQKVQEEGGFNRSCCNAVTAGEEKSGVLTAVEDFLKETSLSLLWKEIPGIHGAGILVDKAALQTNENLAAFLTDFTINNVLNTHLHTVENDRIDTVLQLRRTEKSLKDTTLKLKEAQEEVFFLSERFQNQRAMNFSVRKELESVQSTVESLEATVESLEATVESLQNHTEELTEQCNALLAQRAQLLHSKSWLLTSPLRSLEALRRQVMRYVLRRH